MSFLVEWGFEGVARLELATLFSSVGFGTAENYQDGELVSKMFGPGCFGAFVRNSVDGTLVAMARVLSDDHSVAYISEICVVPSFQGRGIGGSLLKQVQARFSHVALYCCALSGTESFFANGGISAKSKLIAMSRGPRRASAGN